MADRSREKEARSEDPAEEHDAERRARRALLRIAVYVPPAVIGTLLTSSDAWAGQSGCRPCDDPNCWPCKSTKQTTPTRIDPSVYDPQTCAPASYEPVSCAPASIERANCAPSTLQRVTCAPASRGPTTCAPGSGPLRR